MPVVGTIVVVIGSHIGDSSAALDPVDYLLPTHEWSAWTVMFGGPASTVDLALGTTSAAV